MDRFIQNLAIGIAEASSRRGFFSFVVRRLVDSGIGVLFLFDGAQAAFVAGGTCNAVESHECAVPFGQDDCWNGDPMGCNVKGDHRLPDGRVVPGVPGADVPQCITCHCPPAGATGKFNPCVGSTPNVKKWWSCCCGGKMTICVDCQSPGFPSGPLSPRKCICECNVGGCNTGYGRDTCKRGFVWREAVPGDHVCVDPTTRTQAAEDNRLAAQRRAGHGPFGPDTCIQGFVWREATPNDHVCVTLATRAKVHDDNNRAQSRRRRVWNGAGPRVEPNSADY